MAFQLWGATDTLAIVWPQRPLGYVVLFLYSVFFLYTIYHHRSGFRRLTQRQWLAVLALSLVSLLFSQLFPINFSLDNQLAPLSQAQNPITTLTLLAAIPYLLTGAVLNPVAAVVVGLFSGLGRALGQSHQVYDIFHFAFAAVLAAGWLRQNYIGRLYTWLRNPVVAGVLSGMFVVPLMGIATFVSAAPDASSLSTLDLALSTANSHVLPLLAEGAFGGVVVVLVLIGVPQWQQSRRLVPSPEQRSLSQRLLNNFLRFAFLLTFLLVTIVFTLSIRVSTRLVTNQMAHDANSVSQEIPLFRAQLQNLLLQYGNEDDVLGETSAATKQQLQRLFRTGNFYRRLLLVNGDKEILAYYPEDNAPVALTDLEQTAVSETLDTSSPGETAAQTRDSEHVLSFIVPVTDESGEPVAALIGRVPELSLNNLVVGLQGTVGEGNGFVVDENGRIIAHPDSSRLLNYWRPLELPGSVLLSVDNPLPGVAYQGRQGDTNARELVYYQTGTEHPWTVVITVPYEVVLNLALSIGGPLMLVLLVVTAAFAANLTYLGRDITRPIKDLVEASKTITAGGQLNTSQLTQRSDEIGGLGKAFIKMHHSRQQRLDELSLLLSVSHDVSNSIDITQSMPVILRGAVRGTGAVGARAIVLNPSGGRPLTFGEGPRAERMAAFDRQVMRQMRHEQQLLLATSDDVRAALNLTPSEALPAPCLLAVTLRSQDRFQGILWLGYRRANSIGSAERNLLSTLSSQASILVENTRLFATAEGGRRRLAAVLASTTEAVIVTDQTERVLLINRAMERIFDIKAQEVIGRPVTQVLRQGELVRALTGGEERVRHLEISTGDGRVYYTSVSAIINNDGQVLGRVAVLHDVTHFKEIDTMKSEFVATVSHDLRSPLTFMRGYATMLPMVGDLTEKQQEYANKILNGIEQMSKLVDDLLDLGRIESGIEFVTNTIEVETLLVEIASEHCQHARLNGVRLEVDVASQVTPIQGDPALIRQAITNLVNNGIKYAPNSGAIKLRAEQRNGEVVISVADNGPGIPKQEQMRLFEKFYRVKQRGTEGIKGSGLGLAIVKSIAERHGGRVWCRSQAGQGSTFYFSVPVADKYRQNGVSDR